MVANRSINKSAYITYANMSYSLSSINSRTKPSISDVPIQTICMPERVLRLKMSIDDAIAQEQSINCGAGIPRILGVLHYPPTNDKLQPSEFTKIFTEAGASKVVYGHLHGEENFHKGLQGNLNGVEYILASADKTGCRLVKLV